MSTWLPEEKRTHHPEAEPIFPAIPERMSIRDLFSAALDMPWVAFNEVRRMLSIPIHALLFSLHGVRPGKGWRVYGMPIIQRYRGSRIEIGERVWMRSWLSSNPLSPNHPVVLATRSADAVIKVGKDVGMTGTTIVAANSIIIGDRVLIGANSSLVDTDFHPLDFLERQRNPLNGRTAPIVIEEDVFIGMNSLILKGVKIGRGAVIGAGSVVVSDVSPEVVAAGNPAQVIRRL